jgi:hypothetical protein
MAYATVRYGARGETVEFLQRCLATVGAECGAVDGIFGTRTASAVTGFQRACGLVADGVVGPRTWAALGAGPAATDHGQDAPAWSSTLSDDGGAWASSGGGGGGGSTGEPAESSSPGPPVVTSEGEAIATVVGVAAGGTAVKKLIIKDLSGLIGAAGGAFVSAAVTWYNLYCLMSPCSVEEFEARERENIEMFRDIYPELQGRLRAGERPPLFAAGCEADHHGTSWSGPYRLYEEEANYDLYMHVSEWGHEIVEGDPAIQPLPDCQFVAGCDGDHDGASWCGPVRETYDQAVYDLELHMAEWPSHTGAPGASVQQV